MYQSSNMPCPCKHTQDAYYQPGDYACDYHDCNAPDCHHCCHPHMDCNDCDPENYYACHKPCPAPCASCPPCTSCPPSSCCHDLVCTMQQSIGKKIIICMDNGRACIVPCEVCGTFVKALALKCGKTVYINICKINAIDLPYC